MYGFECYFLFNRILLWKEGRKGKILTQFDRMLLRGGKKFRVQKSLDNEGRREAARGSLGGVGGGRLQVGGKEAGALNELPTVLRI